MKGFIPIALVAAAAMASCARAGPGAPTETTRPPATSVAAAPINGGVISISDAVSLLVDAIGERRLALLGEMHGTREIPVMTGELAAQYAARSDAVLFGLEIPSDDQGRVDRYIESAGNPADRAALLAGEHWREPHHDGRDSRAMFDLIERMRGLRADGADVSVILFDAPGGGERDQRMAVALRAAIERKPDAMVLVLTGNVHAMTGTPPPMIHGGKPYALPPTLGRRLADLSPLSIDIRASRGQFVRCEAGVCAPQAVRDQGPERVTPTLERSEGRPWDMTLTLPRFTVSEPAIDARYRDGPGPPGSNTSD